MATFFLGVPVWCAVVASLLLARRRRAMPEPTGETVTRE